MNAKMMVGARAAAIVVAIVVAIGVAVTVLATTLLLLGGGLLWATEAVTFTPSIPNQTQPPPCGSWADAPGSAYDTYGSCTI
jgi:hypothetical protein